MDGGGPIRAYLSAMVHGWHLAPNSRHALAHVALSQIREKIADLPYKYRSAPHRPPKKPSQTDLLMYHELPKHQQQAPSHQTTTTNTCIFLLKVSLE